MWSLYLVYLFLVCAFFVSLYAYRQLLTRKGFYLGQCLRLLTSLAFQIAYLLSLKQLFGYQGIELLAIVLLTLVFHLAWLIHLFYCTRLELRVLQKGSLSMTAARRLETASAYFAKMSRRYLFRWSVVNFLTFVFLLLEQR